MNPEFNNIEDEILPEPKIADIAVFGGSFDPIHNGHLAIAQAVIDSGKAKEVIFVPAAKPPHKQGKFLLSGEDRLKMIDLAIEGSPGFSSSDFELTNKSRISFSYNTLNSFHGIFAGKYIGLIIGMDNFHDFHTWYHYQDIIENYELIIFTRPGTKLITRVKIEQDISRRHSKKLLESIIDDVNVDISSSEIREHISKENDISEFVPERVRNYIKKNQLYENQTND